MSNYEEIKTGEETTSWKKISGVVSEYAQYGVRFKNVEGEGLILKLYISVPKSSDIYHEDGNEMAGTYLAKKFKEDLLSKNIIDVPFKLFAATDNTHYTNEDYEHRKQLSPIIDRAIKENIDADESINRTITDSIKESIYNRSLKQIAKIVNIMIKSIAYGMIFMISIQTKIKTV